MKLPRRKLLHLAAGAVALPAISRIASALDYPARPVRWIVGFPAGGLNDIVARLTGQYLSERLGQPFFIDNRPGAGGNIATGLVANAAPDGYTLLLIGSSNTVNPTLYDNLTFDFIRDIAPVAGIIRAPLVMEVGPSFPARTVPEFMAYARANPGKIDMASGGNGTSLHMTGELFKMMTKIDMVHVPYRGEAPALADLLGGQVQVLFDNLPSSIGHIKGGRLRALAVTTAKRSDALPDVPTVAETVPGFEASVFYGLAVPKDTPRPIIDKLNKAINAALADPAMQAKLAELGGASIAGTPEDFGKIIADETAKWAKVVTATGATAE